MPCRRTHLYRMLISLTLALASLCAWVIATASTNAAYAGGRTMVGFEANGALLSGQGQAQSLEILEAGDVVVDWTTLQEQEGEQKGKLVLHIRNNNTAREQVITLQIIGPASLDSDTPSLLSVMSVAPVTHTVGALDTEDFVLQFDTSKEPKAGRSYSGTLVATGSFGGVVQRKLTLQVGTPTPTPVPEVPVGEPLPVTLRPDKGGSITMTGTSYWPSFLIAEDPTQLYLSFLLVGAIIVVSLIFWQRGGGRPSLRLWKFRLPWWLLIEAALILLFTFAISVNTGDVEPVVVNTMPASALSGVAPVTVMSPAGRLGTVRVEEGFLRAESISQGGKYSGQIDLLPADEENAVTTLAVNIADWWPWALLSVLAGIVISFWVTDYYQRRRAQQDLDMKRAELLDQIMPEDEGFALTRLPWLPEYNGYSMQAVANSISDQIIDDIKNNDTKAASEKFGQLRKYRTLFHKFHADLVELFKLQSRVWRKVPDDVGVKREQMDVFVQADNLLRGERPLAIPPEDNEGTTLKALDTSVAEVTAWLKTLERSLDNIAAYLRDAENEHIPENTTVGERETLEEKLAEQKSKWVDLRQEALMVASKDKLAAIDDAADTAWRTLWKITHPVQASLEGDGLDETVERDEAVDPVPVAGEMAAQGANDTKSPPRPGRRFRNDGYGYGDYGNSKYEAYSASRSAAVDTVIVMPESPRPKPEEEARENFLKSSRAFRLDEQQMTFIAGLITLLTGFTLLYFGNPTWGAPADYLNALLWGSGVSSGLKLIISLVNRTWTNG